MIPMPWAWSDRTTRNRLARSFSPSRADGSSMIRMRVFRLRALAISTSCCSAMDSDEIGASTESSTPSVSRISRVRALTVDQSTLPPFVGRWPRKTFSATVRSWARLNSW